MKIGRNDLCPCGSGKKYKKCCINKASEGKNEIDPINENRYKIFTIAKALELVEKQNQSETIIVGVAYNQASEYAPYQFYVLDYDESDGPWYSFSYYGGFLWEDGRDGEEESYGGETIDKILCEVNETFKNIGLVNFFEIPGYIDFERYAEVVLPELFPDLPTSAKLTSSKMKSDYEQLCIAKINQVNNIKS